MGFEIDGLEEWKEELQQLNEKFPEEKEKEMKKLGLIATAQIKPLIPTDTGRLRNSVFSQLVDNDTVEIVAPTDYASYVNNGFTIKPRFISKEKMLEESGGKNWQKYNVNTSIESKVGPTSYIQETVKLPITDARVKGFTTHYQFILGKHFMEKGFQNAEPIIIAEIDQWLSKLFKAGE